MQLLSRTWPWIHRLRSNRNHERCRLNSRLPLPFQRIARPLTVKVSTSTTRTWASGGFKIDIASSRSLRSRSSRCGIPTGLPSFSHRFSPRSMCPSYAIRSTVTCCRRICCLRVCAKEGSTGVCKSKQITQLHERSKRCTNYGRLGNFSSHACVSCGEVSRGQCILT